MVPRLFLSLCEWCFGLLYLWLLQSLYLCWRCRYRCRRLGRCGFHGGRPGCPDRGHRSLSSSLWLSLWSLLWLLLLLLLRLRVIVVLVPVLVIVVLVPGVLHLNEVQILRCRKRKILLKILRYYLSELYI